MSLGKGKERVPPKAPVQPFLPVIRESQDPEPPGAGGAAVGGAIGRLVGATTGPGLGAGGFTGETGVPQEVGVTPLQLL